MDIRLLGPVEVVVDEQVRSLPGAGERELLALLALAAGRVVAAPALVDGLWGEALPVNPGNALQVRMSKLRRALAAAGAPGELVVTRPPGYLLDLDHAGVDALRFADQVAAARAAAAADPVAAAGLYREALAAWRGPALAEFAGSAWAGPEAARLAELQLAAREELVDLELAAGRHAEVLGELEQLTTAHPLRERLQGRLMLALYRTGRQADALAAYQRARTVLDAELGLEPGAELRGLQEAILQQRPELAAPARAATEPAPAASATPAPRPAPTPARPRLPARLTSFLGRGADLQRVGELLRTARLVTVTGPGGVGKTSLALEAARAAAEHFGDGAAFVRLAGVTDPAQVCSTVLAALEIRDVATATAEDQLLGHVEDRSVLLVLDNCEHLADACALLAERLLETCPDVRLLATSREPLAARGEVQYAIDPLPVPPEDADAAGLTGSAAAELFLDRARAARPDLDLRETDAAAVADICRHLDGMPLALELAAARVAALPVGELAARMGDRFTLLTTGPRTAEARQRTLRATVDWSYQLLTDPERVLLRRLSVFRSSWSLDAMQAVAADAPLDSPGAVDLLGRLVDRSLVVLDRTGADRAAGPRYHLLETIRQYAAERLAEAGESDAIARAHADHFTALAERAETELRGDGQARWLPRLAAERDDIDAALAWCTAHADTEPDTGLRLVGSLGWYWYFATHPDGGRRVAAMLAAAPGGSPAARARALQALAVAARPGACIVHPNPDCAAAAGQSRALFVELGDTFRAALSDTLAAVEAIGGPETAAAFTVLAEADREFTRDGEAWCAALADFVRLELHAGTGDLDAATADGRHALAAFRVLGDQWGVSAIQFHLGMALHRAGRLEEALAMYEGALASVRDVGPANTVQYALAGAGHVTLLLGDTDRAEQLFTESHAVARRLGAEGNPRAAVGEGLLARERGAPGAARERLTFAQQLLAGLTEKPEWTAVALVGLGHLAEADGDLDSAEFFHRRAWQTAPGHAAALEGLACVAAARGDAEATAGLLGAAAAWRRERHWPASRLERVDAERAEHGARAVLSDSAFDAAYQVGEARLDAVLDDPDRVPARR
jgi:predicted ATPase/DNA-binding SARP family transcriptional activator